MYFSPQRVDTGTGEAASKAPENVGPAKPAESKPQPAPQAAKPEPLKSDPNKPGEHAVVFPYPTPLRSLMLELLPALCAFQPE